MAVIGGYTLSGPKGSPTFCPSDPVLPPSAPVFRVTQLGLHPWSPPCPSHLVCRKDFPRLGYLVQVEHTHLSQKRVPDRTRVLTWILAFSQGCCLPVGGTGFVVWVTHCPCGPQVHTASVTPPPPGPDSSFIRDPLYSVTNCNPLQNPELFLRLWDSNPLVMFRDHRLDSPKHTFPRYQLPSQV